MATNPRWRVQHRWYGSEEVVDAWLQHLLPDACASATHAIAAADAAAVHANGAVAQSIAGEQSVTAELEAVAAKRSESPTEELQVASR